MNKKTPTNKSSNKKGRDGLTVKVKTARGRRPSSTEWLRRQLNDPFVDEAKKRGYRSRAAFKLTDIDDKFNFIRPNMSVVDLGCAPGSWCQVIRERTKNRGRVVGIDLQEVDPIPGVELMKGDFTDNDVLKELELLVGDKVDAVVSDMAAAACGHSQTDHIRIMALCEMASAFAVEWLNDGGTFVAKVLRGGAEQELLKDLRKNFEQVKHFKPNASRKDSAEIFVVALGFKGKKSLD